MKFVVFKSSYDYSDIMCRDLEDDKDVVLIDFRNLKWSNSKKILYKIYNRLIVRLLKITSKRLWYSSFVDNNKIAYDDDVVFCFFDSAVLANDAEFLGWLKKTYKNSKLVSINYNILSGKDHYVDFLKEHYDLNMTFDFEDAKKYGFEHFVGIYSKPYDTNFRVECDIFFSGLDKGRLETLKKIYIDMKQNGVKSLFYVVSNRECLNDDDQFIVSDKRLSYEESIASLMSANCILEIVPKEQTGMSLRTIEAIVYNKKLLTNNSNVVDNPFYNEKYISLFNLNDGIDYQFVKEKINVDYKYHDEFSPKNLLILIENKLKNN